MRPPWCLPPLRRIFSFRMTPSPVVRPAFFLYPVVDRSLQPSFLRCPSTTFFARHARPVCTRDGQAVFRVPRASPPSLRFSSTRTYYSRNRKGILSQPRRVAPVWARRTPSLLSPRQLRGAREEVFSFPVANSFVFPCGSRRPEGCATN